MKNSCTAAALLTLSLTVERFSPFFEPENPDFQGFGDGGRGGIRTPAKTAPNL